MLWILCLYLTVKPNGLCSGRLALDWTLNTAQVRTGGQLWDGFCVHTNAAYPGCKAAFLEPFTLMLMACGEWWSGSQTDPITTCTNEQINEVFSLHMRCQRTGSRGLNFTTCKIHKRETKIAFILDFSHSTIEPTFWCHQTKEPAWRSVVALPSLDETDFIYPGPRLK